MLLKQKKSMSCALSHREPNTVAFFGWDISNNSALEASQNNCLLPLQTCLIIWQYCQSLRVRWPYLSCWHYLSEKWLTHDMLWLGVQLYFKEADHGCGTRTDKHKMPMEAETQWKQKNPWTTNSPPHHPELTSSFVIPKVCYALDRGSSWSK